MKILTNNSYNELLKIRAEKAEEIIRLQKEISKINFDKNKALQHNENLTQQNDELSRQLSILEIEIEDLKMRLKISDGRVGGLQAKNNKFFRELEKSKQIIENFKNDIKANHKILSVNGYDKRFPLKAAIKK